MQTDFCLLSRQHLESIIYDEYLYKTKYHTSCPYVCVKLIDSLLGQS